MNAWNPTSNHDHSNACKAASLSSQVYSDNIGCDFKFKDEATDTEVFGWASSDQILIGFRGTSSIKDAAIDLKFHKVPFEVPDTSHTGAFRIKDLKRDNLGRVHRGFLMAVGSVWEHVRKWLRGVYYDQPLFIFGHSLGAANATILAMRLQLDGFNVTAAYTFGSPRVGDRKFARIFNEKISHYRYVNNNDVVTRMPPFIFFAVHCGFEYYINRKGQRVILGLFGKMWDRLAGRVEALFRSGTVIDGAKDHSSAHYVRLINQNSSS